MATVLRALSHGHLYWAAWQHIGSSATSLRTAGGMQLLQTAGSDLAIQAAWWRIVLVAGDLSCGQ